MSKRRRLSAQAWRGMLVQFEGSGQSAEEFCQEHDISMASLKRWQQKLRAAAAEASAQRADAASDTVSQAQFVELGALRSSSPRIELRLEFGGGVVLQLSRG